jgi:hypothetical protein
MFQHILFLYYPLCYYLPLVFESDFEEDLDVEEDLDFEPEEEEDLAAGADDELLLLDTAVPDL